MTNALLVHELSTQLIEKELKATKIEHKFIAQQNATGVTFMEGKQRLVKVVNSKKNLKLEINLELSKELEEKLNKGNGILEKISPAKAKEKHLGTMKYLYKDLDEKQVVAIVKDLLKNYKKK